MCPRLALPADVAISLQADMHLPAEGQLISLFSSMGPGSCRTPRRRLSRGSLVVSGHTLEHHLPEGLMKKSAGVPLWLPSSGQDHR